MKAKTRTIALAGLAIVAAGAMLVQSQVKNQNRDGQSENAKDGYRVDVRLLSGRDALNCLLALENTENVVGNDTKTKRALALVILQSVSTMASDPQPADWQLDSESVQFLRDVRDAWPKITKSAKCGSECEELLLDYINAKIRNDSGKMACIHNLSDSASDKNSLDIPGICEIRLAEMSSSPCLDVDPVAGLDEIIVRETGAKQKFPVQFILLVANKSKSTPVFLTQENSSFGYYDLSLELEIDGETYPLTRREVPWYRNIPAYDEISPGSSLARPVSLNPYEWEGFPGQYFNLLAEAACGKQQADNVRLRAALKNGFIRKNGRDVRLKPKVIYSDWHHVRYLEKQDDGL